MSLTRHLEQPDSPIRRFIVDSVPELALAGTRGAAGKLVATRYGFDELTALVPKVPIPPEVKPSGRKAHAITAGIALDYMIRLSLPGFDLRRTSAQKGLDSLGADPGVVPRGQHIHKLLDMSLKLALSSVSQPNAESFSLAMASVPLAWCESIYRAGPVVAFEGSLGRQIRRSKDAGELMMSIEDSLVTDLARMHASIGSLLVDWNQSIASGTAYVPNPTFAWGPAVGGADGDLAIGNLLVEVKTTERITNPWLRETLLQMVGYALLDGDDAHAVRSMGLLLPRQPFIRYWSLDELLGADPETALPELREKFASVLIDMLDAPTRREMPPTAAR